MTPVNESSEITAAALEAMLREARATTLALVADYGEAEHLGPMLRIVNPPLWEIGHLAWFQDKWALRHLRGRAPSRSDGDALYDSAAVPHDSRWGLPLPSWDDTLAYLQHTLGEVGAALRGEPLSDDATYFHLLPLFHEDMHAEALGYTRQTLGYAPPALSVDSSGQERAAEMIPGRGALPGDVDVPGGRWLLGAAADAGFVFDNEKWAHPVHVAPFRIARAPVTNAEFADFVDAGGYREADYWSAAGWRWRQDVGAERPVYWEPAAGGGWLRRRYDAWVPIEPYQAVLHISWFEAEAYCAWAGRRLPTEAEWEMAALAEPGQNGGWRKRRFPWGDGVPTPDVANLDWRQGGCVDAGALPAGDSFFGCRQMIGNVWEWTASDFAPYPGFVVDPYKEYSEPWFGNHKVLRGGCWATRSRLIRGSWRNFYTPDRRDVWAGFRTCARSG